MIRPQRTTNNHLSHVQSTPSPCVLLRYSLTGTLTEEMSNSDRLDSVSMAAQEDLAVTYPLWRTLHVGSTTVSQHPSSFYASSTLPLDPLPRQAVLHSQNFEMKALAPRGTDVRETCSYLPSSVTPIDGGETAGRMSLSWMHHLHRAHHGLLAHHHSIRLSSLPTGPLRGCRARRHHLCMMPLHVVVTVNQSLSTNVIDHNDLNELLPWK